MNKLNLSCVALLALAACSANPHGSFTNQDGASNGGDGASHSGDGASNTCSGAGQIVCVGNSARTCDANGGFSNTVSCPQQCVPGIGCAVCQPGTHSCASDGTPQTCSNDGSMQMAGTACPSGETCMEGICTNPCQQAAMSHSYVGCDYWPVSLVNSALGTFPNDEADCQLCEECPFGDPTSCDSFCSAVGVDGFPFSVAVANPQTVAANITVTGGALTSPLTQMVGPGMLSIINLPWQQDVSQVTQAGTQQQMEMAGQSVLAVNAAYHLVSDVPVTVYQFNSLSYQNVNMSQCDPTNDPSCFSYTNDSSLLLPSTVLTGNYTALSVPTQAEEFQGGLGQPTQFASAGGFVAIVGTVANTHVMVMTTGGVRAGNGVTASSPGTTITQTLGAGDVLELLSADVTTSTECATPVSLGNSQQFQGESVCTPQASQDLTGSIITADQPIAVYGGHDCAFMPFNRLACDHLEQQLFPNETLGTHYFVSRTQPQLSQPEPNLLRILSNAAGNMITFTPASVHAPVMLDRGQATEFFVQSVDVEIMGSGPYEVSQFLVGENYFGNDTQQPPSTVGDPSMALEVPVEQWRTSYEFLAPDTYPVSFVNVVAQHGSTINLDGTALTATPTTTGTFDAYRVDISTQTGAHSISSADGSPFSIKVYGFGSYTSYMYPGGLDLTQISPPG